ncbi:MAG: CDP-alcohol phosphatidyltransferase family protein, partial [Gemmatimonadaceae bacterium]
MFDVFLRAVKDRIFAPVACMIGTRLQPNVVTLLAWLVGLMAAIAAGRGSFLSALLLWIANRVLDGFDGTLARATGAQTDFGGYLDIVLDLSVYAFVVIGLIVEAHDSATAIAGAALIGTFYVNGGSWMYLAAILERRQQGVSVTGERTTITMPAGLVAGTETFVFYVLFLLFP